MGTFGGEPSESATIEVLPDAMTAASRVEAQDRVVPGSKVGRYAIIEQIGAGGMGVVLRAHDPQLDRDVALKRIRSDRSSKSAESRLRREAQSMARLNHPNVVPVYGVEQGPDGLYIAMELVQGQPLSSWLASEPRTIPAILDAFVAAGRGLEAAHEVGLVHRDFKPANVLVGDDGRIRVMDFGLARADPASDDEVDSAVEDEELTDHGVVMGTPAYMAPEQHAGHADARSDQYAFCVALWEAVQGRRPFRGPDLRSAKLAGPPAPGVLHALPPAIGRALARGLDPRPDARWPSMTALLEVLDAAHDRSQRRRRVIVASTGIGLVAVFGVVVAGGETRETQRCEADELRGVWDVDARRRFDVLAANAPQGSEAMRSIRARLDEWAQSYAQAHRQACEAVAVADEPARAIDRRLACLSRQRSDVGARIDLLLGGGDGVVAQAWAVTESLPVVADCMADDALVTPPISDEAALAWLDRVSALMAAASYAEARQEIDARLPELLKVSTPLAREAQGHDCHLLAGEGRYEEAVERCRRAFDEFAAAGEDVRAIDIGAALITTIGHHLGRSDDAEHWVRQVQALVDRLGRRSRAEADFLVALGTLRTEQGRLDDGITALQEAVRIRRGLEMTDEIGFARTLGTLGISLAEAGRLEEAQHDLTEALQIFEAREGANHPDVAVVHNVLGGVASDRGDLDAAWVHYQRSLEIVRRDRGGDHERVGFVLNNLGRVADQRGDYEEARRLYAEGKEIKEKTLGPDHPTVGTSENNLGHVALQSGDFDEAERHFIRALEIFRLAFDDGHPDVLQARANAARAMLGQGRHEEALTEAREAVDAATRLDAEPPILVYVLAVQGDALVRLGRFDEAVEPLERAVALGGEATVEDRAAAQFLLARALRQREPQRAKAEAVEAKRVLRAERLTGAAQSAPTERLLEEIDAWLTEVE